MTVTVTASGGDYGGVTAEVVVSVADGDTAELVVDPDSLTISENASRTFEVRLATRPSASVSVRVSSGDTGAVSVPSQALVFTTGNWSTARTVSVSGVDDDDALDESVTVTVAASGGDYGGVTAEVDVSVTDDDTVNLEVDPGSLPISEDGSGTFEVRLATQPSASVSVRVSSGDTGAVSVPARALVFTTGDWSTAQSVPVSGVDDDDALDESVTVTVTASAGGYGGETAEVEVSVSDDDTAALVVDPDSLTISEDGSGTFELSLATRPSHSVSVTVSSADTGAVSVLTGTLTFTTGDWSTAQSVTVGGVDDDDALDESVTVTLSASGGDYSGETVEVDVSVADDDTVNLVVDPGSLPILEGGPGSFEVSLATRPSARVSVTVSSGDTGAVSVGRTSLTFTTGNWSTAQSVAVGGVIDADALDESVTVTLTASGADYGGETAEVEVSVSDGHTAALVVDPDSLTVAEGGSGTFELRLATRPSASVSVRVSSGDSGAVSVSARALVFTAGNWSTAQSVTVGGVDDDDALDESVTVTLTASGADYGGVRATVEVSVTDDETAALVVDPDSLTISEDGSGTFEVSLATRPSATVSVKVSSGDPDAVTVPAGALTFTTGNWSTAHLVTVSGVDDADALDESVTVTLTASGADYGGVTATVEVSVSDDETAELVVDPDSLTISEDGSGTFELSLASRPSASVSVRVSSGDSGAVSVPSRALVFTTGNWSTAQSVAVEGVDDDDALDESVTVAVTASGADYGGVRATVEVSVSDDETAELVVDPDSLTISEDGSGTFELSLATRPSAQVSVRVSSGDSGAVSVSWGTLLFTTGNWSTARSVTVSGVDDDDALDESVTVTLTASGGDYNGETAEVVVSVADDDMAELVLDRDSLSISEDGSGNVSVRLATRPSASVSVTVSSGDPDAVSVPARALVFTTGNWSTAQLVTAEGVDDEDALDESVTVTVAASGGDYGGETAEVAVSVDDGDTAGLVVDPDSLTISENGSGTFEVQLATRPPASVSVTVSSGDSGAVSVPSQALVFTTGNWSTARTVTVSGVDDDDALDESVTVTVAASGGDYSGETAEVAVSVADGDTARLVVDPDSLTISENGSGTFEVQLATRPPASVSVTVWSGDTGAVSVPLRALVFTTGNWSVSQSVTVGGVRDADALDELVTVTVTALGGDYSGESATVAVTVTDGDTAELVVDPDSLTISENGSRTFAMSLATRPSASVSVRVSSGDQNAVSVPSQALVFTTGDWSTAQLVRVEGVDDQDALDELVTVTVTALGGDYSGESATVAVTVTDGDTAELVVDPDSLTISENGSGAFAMSLATRPSASVSVRVSSGDSDAVSVPSQALVFTTGNWSTAQSVSVGGVDDDDTGDESVTVTLTASGADYGGETATVVVSVADDDTAELVVDPDSLDINESGVGTFGVRLATQPAPTDTITVTVSSGDPGAASVPSGSLTFRASNWSIAQPVKVSGVDDTDALDERLTVTVTAAGGDYANETAIVTVTVIDDDTAGLVVDEGSVTVDEDGTASFGVKLATRPSQQVSVSVSSGDTGAVSVPSQALTFTTGDWFTAQSVTVGGVDDDDAGDESVRVTLTASGGDYGGETASVSVSVADDDTVDFVVDPDSLPISENGSGIFEVSLATRPSARVSVTVSSGDTGAVSVPLRVLTFTTGDWFTAQSVTVGGVDDDDAGDESVTVTLTASGGDYASETATVAVSVDDDDAAGLVVDQGSLSVDEDGMTSFAVWLATEPSQQVSVTVSSGDVGAVSVGTTTLTFSTVDWSTPQSVTVDGVDDDDAGDESVTVTLTASGGDYASETATVAVSVDDDDTAGLVLDERSVTVDEGGMASFDLSLATRPTARVTLTVSSGDVGAVSVLTTTLTFSVLTWSSSPSVTVEGVDDDDAGDESVTLTITASGGDYNGETATVTVTVMDDDTPELVVDRLSVLVDEGGRASFDVWLATQPTQDVSVEVSSADLGAVSVPPTTLTFTPGNWSRARSVSVGGVDDHDARDESVAVTLTASGGDYGGETAIVGVVVDDDDTVDLAVGQATLSVREGGTASFDVWLATEPSQQVSVSVSSDDTGAVSVPPQVLTFTRGNWSTVQTVTVGGVDDDDAMDESVTVTLTASGGDYSGEPATVVVSVDDDDTPALIVDPDSLTVSEADSQSFEVSLATRPSVSVSVTVSSGDTGAVSVPSQALTFSTGNWSTAQSVRVDGVDDDDAMDESVTVTLTASGGDYSNETATVAVSVDDGDTAELVVDPDSLTISEAGSQSFVVSLATRPSVSVSVSVASGDTGALSVSSQALTFTTGNWSSPQSVTVRGVDDDDARDETVTVTLTASGGDYAALQASVTVSVSDDDTVELIVDQDSLSVNEGGTVLFDVWLATEPSQQVSVSVSSGDSGAVSVPSQALTFTTGNWSSPQSVTVGGAVDDDALDESVTVTLTASGGDYSGETAAVDVAVTDGDTADLLADLVGQVVEGRMGSFDVWLATEPSQEVSVSVSSSDSGALSVQPTTLTFTADDWSTVQSVTLRGVEDDDGIHESVTVTLTASGGDYEGEKASVTVSVDDNDTVELIVDRNSLSVEEGGMASFDVWLATEPSQQVSVSVSSGDSGAVSVPLQALTFTTSNWATRQVVRVGGVDDNDASDELVTVTLTTLGGDYGNEMEEVAVTVTDDETADLVVDPGSLTIDEDANDTFTVSLATQPTQQVSVSVSSGDTGAVLVPSQVLRFTRNDWSSPQSVTVGGVVDDDAGDESVIVTLRASGGDYGGETATVAVSVDDDDTTGLVVDPSSLTVNEGVTASFDVTLETEPLADVDVSISSGDPGAAAASRSFKFTSSNWNIAQSVTVRGVNDDDAGDESVTIRLIASGGDYTGETATVAVTVTDNDTPALVVDPESLTVAEDGSAAFTVRLATRPTQAVTVTAFSDDAQAASVPSHVVTFTTGDWSTAQSVPVSGVHDVDAGDESVRITVTASGGDSDYQGLTAAVSVTVTDDETPNLVATPGSLTIDEDARDTFTVRLATQPTQQVSVTVSSSDAGAASVPSRTLTFTTQNWATAQSVRVSGVGDADASDESVTVTLSASGGDYEGKTATVAVTILDDETAGIRSRTRRDINEGDQVNFTVTLTAEPTEQVTIALSSSDPGALSLSTTTMVFTTLNWWDLRTVRLTGVEDDDVSDETVTLTLTVASSGADYAGKEAIVEVTVLDDDRVPPSAPDTLQVIREERTQLYVEWAASTSVGSPVTGYTVSWREPGGGWTEATATTPSASITGLSAGTEYAVRAKANNSFGDSAWSGTVTAYTDDCAAGTAHPCAITVGNAATGRINVHDTVADRDWFAVWLMRGQVYRFEVEGSEASDSGGTLADPELSVYTPSGTLVAGATNNDGGVGSNPLLLFTPDSTGAYHVEVGEHGGDEVGTYTVVAALEMSPRFVGSTGFSFPENLSVDQQIVAVDDDADDSILDFQITGGADMDKFSISSQGDLQMIITPNYEDPEDSDNDNTYEVEITVFSGPSTGVADGSASATFTITILNVEDERPGIPQDLMVRHEDLNSIRVGWHANPADTEPNSLYELEVTETGQAPFVITGSSTTMTAESLTQDKHYRFRVRAKNGDGYGDWTAQISGYTDDCGDGVIGACPLAGGAERMARINIKDSIAGDADWFAVTATNRSQAFRLHAKGSEATDPGGTLRDPSLNVRNHLGHEIPAQTDDNRGAGLNAAHLFTIGHLDYTPSTFYIEVVRSRNDTSGILGTYTMSAVPDVRATVISDRNLEVTENSALSYHAVIEDPDDGDTVSDPRISSDDAAFFTIDADYNITMTIDPDFERPQDANGNNVYNIALVFLNTTVFGSAPWEIHTAMTVKVLDDDTEEPGVPQNRRIVSELNYTVALWDPPTNLGPEVNLYQVRIADASESPFNWSTRSLLGVVRFNTWSNLSQDIEYVWQVRAANDEGDGPWSPKQYFYVDECAGSPGADTCTIAINSSESGGINPKESDQDNDLYEISLQSNHQYRIDVTGSAMSDSVGALADPYLRVLDSDGDPIVGADNNDGGSGLNARLLFEPSASDTYYVEVSENGGDAVGSYDVAVEVIDSPPRFVGSQSTALEEHVDLRHQLMATDQEVGHAIAGYSIIGGPDMNKFSVDSNGILSMTITPNFEDPQDVNRDNNYEVAIRVFSGPGGGQRDRHASVDFNVAITDRTDEAPGVPDPWALSEERTELKVGWSEPLNDGPSINAYMVRIRQTPHGSFVEFPLPANARSHTWRGLNPAKLYLVQVRAENNEGRGSWSQELYALTDDCSQSTTNACPLAVAVSDRGIINVDLTADKDWFEITLEANHLYRIDVEGYGIDVLGDPEVRVYDSSGASIAGAYDNDDGPGLDARLLFEPASNDTYYIEVGEHGGDGVGWYELTVTVTDAPPRILGTRSLFLEENATLRHQVTATDNDRGHAITGFSISGGADMDKFAINANGILSMTIDPDHEAPEDADGDNTYEVIVAANSGPGGGVADRQTTADFSVAIDDVDEAPGSPGAPTVTATRRQLEFAWDEPDNSGQAIDSYEIRLAERGTSDWTSVTVASVALAYSWQTLEVGTWYEYQVRAINDEGLSNWTTLASVATDDCTGRTTNACTVTVGGSATGLIGVDTKVGKPDRDWFRVSLEANVRYRIKVNGNSLEDPELKIYDSAGDAVTGAEDNDSGSGLNARYVFEPTSAGDYYVEAFAHDGNALGRFGTYTVLVRLAT